jgi:ribosomal protein S18 acetylase RimI-like enzyme
MRQVIEETWGWDEAWQRNDFDRRFGECAVSIIEREGRPAGALWLESKPDSIYVHELQVLPEYQGLGIGTTVIRHLIDGASSKNVSVTLSVLAANPRAKRLYERLGQRLLN